MAQAEARTAGQQSLKQSREKRFVRSPFIHATRRRRDTRIAQGAAAAPGCALSRRGGDNPGDNLHDDDPFPGTDDDDDNAHDDDDK